MDLLTVHNFSFFWIRNISISSNTYIWYLFNKNELAWLDGRFSKAELVQLVTWLDSGLWVNSLTALFQNFGQHVSNVDLFSCLFVSKEVCCRITSPGTWTWCCSSSEYSGLHQQGVALYWCYPPFYGSTPSAWRHYKPGVEGGLARMCLPNWAMKSSSLAAKMMINITVSPVPDRRRCVTVLFMVPSASHPL